MTFFPCFTLTFGNGSSKVPSSGSSGPVRPGGLRGRTLILICMGIAFSSLGCNYWLIESQPLRVRTGHAGKSWVFKKLFQRRRGQNICHWLLGFERQLQRLQGAVAIAHL